ncbi:hypothetical protein GTO27_10715 [Candidatus Bathyarchaeota archaeon]|nr:hypothetical protein [Candidatus Bathyarchaeota archaeon]
MGSIIERLTSIRLPKYLKATHLKFGLTIGAIWGFLSTVIFVTVGMFARPDHPYHWLYRSFQTSFDMLWFQVLFLPFVLLAQALFSLQQSSAMYAVFAATPFGAMIGLGIGVLTSLMSYLIQK